MAFATLNHLIIYLFFYKRWNVCILLLLCYYFLYVPLTVYQIHVLLDRVVLHNVSSLSVWSLIHITRALMSILFLYVSLGFGDKTLSLYYQTKFYKTTPINKEIWNAIKNWKEQHDDSSIERKLTTNKTTHQKAQSCLISSQVKYIRSE